MVHMPLCRGARRSRLHPVGRLAFTLLEVLLAATICVLLMAALYVAVDVQLRHAQAGRDLAEHSILVRNVFNRIVNDITPTMAPALPTSSSSSGGSSGSGGGSGGSASTGTSSANTGTSSGGTTGSGSSTGSASTNATIGSNGAVVYNLGLQGDNGQFTLSISRTPSELNISPSSGIDPSALPLVTDIRRITFWLVNGGDVALGLARQEIRLVASDDQMSVLPPGIPDEATYVIAEEVRSLNFRYFDGTAWQDTWDSTQPGSDGTTPMGPPLAIEVVLGIALPGARGEANVKTYRHVIPLPAANGLPQQNQSTTSTPQ